MFKCFSMTIFGSVPHIVLTMAFRFIIDLLTAPHFRIEQLKTFQGIKKRNCSVQFSLDCLEIYLSAQHPTLNVLSLLIESMLTSNRNRHSFATSVISSEVDVPRATTHYGH